MNFITLIIISLFFLIVFLIGIIDRKKITLEDYWVNSRKTNKWVLVATTVSSFLGVGAFMSNASLAYSGGGFATLIFIVSYFFGFLIFAKFFASKVKEFGDRYKAYTLPDFLEHRYSKRVRVAGLIVNLVTYGLWLALQILGMGIFVSAVGGLDPSLATLIGGMIVIAYTTIGGLRADIRTDIFQFFVMLSLLFVFFPIIIIKNHGFGIIGALPASFLSGSEFAPLYVFILGFLFLGACNIVGADLWQRAYAGDTSKNVRWAVNVSGVLTFLFLIMGMLLGIYGKVILPGITPDMVIPGLLKLYLSPVLFGIVLAGFFAAIMSTADTMLLITTMTLVHDLYQKTFNKNVAPEKLLSISRWTSLLIGSSALLIAITIFNLIHLAFEAASFYVALLPAVIFGFYGKRQNESAAFWSILLGFLAILAFIFVSPVQAFIPGIMISCLSFFIISLFAQKKKL